MEKWKAETQEKLFDPVSAFHLSLSSFQLFTMSAFPFISVVIPACNPGMRHFQIVLDALRDQTLPKDRWELIVVDDASRTPLVLRDGRVGEKAENLKIGKAENEGLRGEKPDEQQRTDLTKNEALIDLSWHPNARLVQTDPEREGGEEKAENLKSAKAENEGACGERERRGEKSENLKIGKAENEGPRGEKPDEQQRTDPTKNEALIDLSWHPNARLVETDPEREGLGLVSARLRGFELGKGDVFVFVDQDNALQPDYLQGVADIAVEYPHIGTWGGQILLKFDEPDKAPAVWLRPDLCTRELTQDVWSNVINHHDSTPWGAGLCARREVLEAYRRRVLVNPMRRLLDPTPRRAGFGGDSDLAYAGCVLGYGKGAFKRLVLDHLIPVGRCSPEYFVRLAESKGYSEIRHGYVEEGRTRRPRNDWKYHLMQFLRAPFEDSLRRTVKNAYRKGQWTAVAELSSRPGELRNYAMKLQRKAQGLAAR